MADSVCLILPTHRLLPLNQSFACSRLKSKPSAPWCLSSGTWGAHSYRSEMPCRSPLCSGRKCECCLHPLALHVLSLLSPTTPHLSLICGGIILKSHWNHIIVLPKSYLHLLFHMYSENHLSLWPPIDSWVRTIPFLLL